MLPHSTPLSPPDAPPSCTSSRLLAGDEETAMKTQRALAAKYKGAEMALNGDGGGGLIGEDGKAQYYGLQAGEKTYADFTLEVTNPGGHSSRPGPINAIVQL